MISLRATPLYTKVSAHPLFPSPNSYGVRVGHSRANCHQGGCPPRRAPPGGGWGPVVLTVGKATGLRERLEQHFAATENNNRVLKRMRLLLPPLADNQIRELVISDLDVQWRRFRTGSSGS
jgi:hypothetical protein